MSCSRHGEVLFLHIYQQESAVLFSGVAATEEHRNKARSRLHRVKSVQE